MKRLQERIAYQFNDLGLLERALTHRSLGAKNNERLEFLGDSVLGLVISSHLFQRLGDLGANPLQQGVAAPFAGGDCYIGHDGDGFRFDNETPRHRVWLEDFRLASRPVSNAEYQEIIGLRTDNSTGIAVLTNAAGG